MTDPLREAGPLVTAHQLPAVLAERDVFLTACPGSGKTRTAAVRVARLADDGYRVAACSYTNVGVDELRHVLAHDVGVHLGAEHFTGTLHQFLLRYVLYPFGQLVLGSSRSPRVVGPGTGWDDVVFDRKNRLAPHYFQFDPEGGLCIRGALPVTFTYRREQALARGHEQARSLKEKIARERGWVSMDDAMYWALQVLQRYPRVVRALSGRFDELLIDEAQDTSELQLACLHQLHAGGRLRSLTLVGDLEQSIFSYNGAHPTGCEDLAATRGLIRVPLRENRRCSQRICDVAVHFCSRTAPDQAVGPDAHLDQAPELVLYPDKDPRSTIQDFHQRLIELDEDPLDAAVLARTNSLVDELNQTTKPKKVSESALAVARAAHAQRTGATLGRRELDRLDQQLAETAWGIRDTTELAVDHRWALRRATIALLIDAPELTGDMHSWTQALRTPYAAALALLTDTPCKRPGDRIRAHAETRRHQVIDLVARPDAPLHARTVHDIKGASADAVLFVVARPGRRSSATPTAATVQGIPPAALLGRALSGTPVDPELAEELRIAFVAITRARRLCRLALPASTDATVTNHFVAGGFQLLQRSSEQTTSRTA